ncbi:HTH lysR-type domain-containing protein [Hyphomicrobiales bacterium]|nr:HTH lysR-type domain-containing protein [Hyphomicrobiales bacterium]CAH1698348.1 HTH lysR-type domain-containing protein [Hyphomicrobiales bacterium]CAI0342004.1 HTH lysR-type domain-containing protein [Hyphomicrobiales bacterium]
MDLRQFETFVSIATLRSFRAAANRLNVTQPAISLRLSALEQELGVKLIERTGSIVRPTAKGLELLAYAEQVLDGVNRFKSTARSAGEPQSVRLGATSTIVHAWLTDLLRLLRAEFPNLVIEMTIDTSPRLRASLVGGALDVAILMGPVHEAGVRQVPLGTYRTAWIASRELAVRFNGRDLILREIAQHWVVTHARDSATYASIEELFRTNGLYRQQISSSNSVEAIIRLARSGLAIGALSEACVALDDPDLQRLPCEFELPSYEFSASYHLDTMSRMGMIVAELSRQCASAHLASLKRSQRSNLIQS